MNEKILYRGTRFIAQQYKVNVLVSKEEYILVEYYDLNYVFQVVKITGYHAGNIMGYIEVEDHNIRGISIEHFKNQLEKRIFDPECRIEFELLDKVYL